MCDSGRTFPTIAPGGRRRLSPSAPRGRCLPRRTSGSSRRLRTTPDGSRVTQRNTQRPLKSMPRGWRADGGADGKTSAAFTAPTTSLRGVLGPGDSVPDVQVWTAPREEARLLRQVLGAGLTLLSFYLWDCQGPVYREAATQGSPARPVTVCGFWLARLFGAP